MQREPVGVAAFVGRESERVEVANLVIDGRVVTLAGSGGCGKTRLAMEVVGDVASRFDDGAVWVDLQGVSDPAMVAPTVGAAIEVHEQPGEALTDTLADRLHDQHLLLAIDNCEHLVGACAALVDRLSSACPYLHLLATSRVPLAVEGEATFGVAPLPVPDVGDTSASMVAGADAARLFELRARQVRTDFRIDDDNAAAVAAICRRLDGIPLAIELAAARVRVLAPDQIAAGLADRFGLLTGGVRAAPARQETLEASLDWSWDLLGDREQATLARLAVFAGSFELDAAEAVVVGDGTDCQDVLDLVTGLVDQSLLQVTHHEGRARYRLLETIREYARQQLSELGDSDHVCDRHLQFHVGLVRRARDGLTGGETEHWAARLTADLDNLRAAMDWAAESGDLSALVDLTEPIIRFWFDRGLSREVHQRLGEAARESGVSDQDRARALVAAAPLAQTVVEPASAHRYATSAVEAARAAGLTDVLAIALAQRAWAAALSGLSTNEQVTADVEEALQYARQCEDASTHAYVLAASGASLVHSNAIDAASTLFAQAVSVCESNDLAYQLASALSGPGSWLVWSGRLDSTHERARRGVELSRRLGRAAWEAAGLAGLGAVAVLRGDHDRARERLTEAQDVLRSRGLEESLQGMWVRHWRALAAHAASDVETERVLADEIVRVGRSGGSRMDEAVGEWLLGALARDEGHHDDARAHLRASRSLSSSPRLPFPLGRSLLGLSDLSSRDEDPDEAWELAHDGLEVLDEYGDRVGTATALETIADQLLVRDDAERSLRLLAASQRFHDDTRIVRFPFAADRFRRVREAATGALGDEATACWNAGSALSLADAVTYARRGRGERQRPTFGWASLTPAERDVVALVAEGHTNAEIGERLFISVNTVKKHLTHVYAKVDVDGRADLAAQVARRELESPRGG